MEEDIACACYAPKPFVNVYQESKKKVETNFIIIDDDDDEELTNELTDMTYLDVAEFFIHLGDGSRSQNEYTKKLLFPQKKILSPIFIIEKIDEQS